MAWERRGDKRYYYRSIKVGGKVKKVYFGTGPEAELASLAAERRREERARHTRKLERQRECCRQMENAFERLNEELDLLAKAVLVAAGCCERSRGFRPPRADIDAAN